MAKLLKLINGIPKMADAPGGDTVYTQTVVNAQGSPANITDAILDKDVTRVFVVEYSVVRWHSTSKAFEQGTFAGLYDLATSEWILSGATYKGNASGVDFYITNAGQLQYTSTSRAGTVNESYLKVSIKTL